MANIEYKSDEEKLYRKSFNPFVASKEEIENDMKEQYELFISKVSELDSIIGGDMDYLKKIVDGAKNSSPFDKRIIYNSNVKAVDELKLYDFKDEKTFKQALSVYYCIVWTIYNRKIDRIALAKK